MGFCGGMSDVIRRCKGGGHRVDLSNAVLAAALTWWSTFVSEVETKNKKALTDGDHNRNIT
jgi:hypothetical protein